MNSRSRVEVRGTLADGFGMNEVEMSNEKGERWRTEGNTYTFEPLTT